MTNLDIPIARTGPYANRATIPTRAHDDDAGLDLYTPIRVEIENGATTRVPLGLSIGIPRGYVGLIYARSGLATQHGVHPTNSVGVIDSGYTGEVSVSLTTSHKGRVVRLEAGERFAQLVIQPIQRAVPHEVTELPTTARGTSGFGSTGTRQIRKGEIIAKIHQDGAHDPAPTRKPWAIVDTEDGPMHLYSETKDDQR